MVKKDQFNPEESLKFLKQGKTDFAAAVLAMREAVIYLLEKEVTESKHLQAIWDSDARAMEDMAKQAKEIEDKERLQAK